MESHNEVRIQSKYCMNFPEGSTHDPPDTKRHLMPARPNRFPCILRARAPLGRFAGSQRLQPRFVQPTNHTSILVS